MTDIVNTPPAALDSIRIPRPLTSVLAVGRNLGALVAACVRAFGGVTEAYSSAIEQAYVKSYSNASQQQPKTDENIDADRDPSW